MSIRDVKRVVKSTTIKNRGKKTAPRRRTRRAPSTRAVLSKKGGVVTGVSMVRTSKPMSGQKFHFSTAPANEITGGFSGMRMTLRFSPYELWRHNTYTYYTLTRDGGTNFFQGFGTNPMVDVTYYMASMFGAQTFNIPKMLNMFMRYAVRQLKVKYNPSQGAAETGQVAMLWLPEVETTQLTQFNNVKNCDGAYVFNVNEPFTRDVLKSNLSRPAPQLFYVDPTTDTTTGKMLCQQGRLIFVNDMLSAAAFKLGNIEIECVVDLYNLTSETQVASSQHYKMVRVVPEAKEAKEAKSVIEDNYVEIPEANSTSMSTSSVTSSVAGSLNRLTTSVAGTLASSVRRTA